MLDGTVKESLYPLNFHITPTVGLLNDPNGLIHFKGVYHVFYQWNPAGTTHANKAWGHVTSPDMIRWERQPVALVPSESYDKDGIYSGSAVEKDGKLYLFYTGNVIEDDGERRSFQCRAVSTDGKTFEKTGPLFEHPAGYTRHVRDPKVWFEKADNCWYLILGAQRDSEEGTALLYRSDDFDDWHLQGELFPQAELAQLSQQGYMWECPDLFDIDGNWFYLYCPQGLVPQGTHYQNLYQTIAAKVEKKGVGEFHFPPQRLLELDWGFDSYAPQTFVASDGRRILYSWMGVMTLEKESAMPTQGEQWLHCLTVPRELFVRNGHLCQRPVIELTQLRQEGVNFELESGFTKALPQTGGELILDIDQAADFSVAIGKTMTFHYSQANQELTLERLDWLTEAIETRHYYLTGLLTQLHMLIDRSAVEVFVNGGEAAAAARFFEVAQPEIRLEGEIKGQGQWYSLGRMEVTEEMNVL